MTDIFYLNILYLCIYFLGLNLAVSGITKHNAWYRVIGYTVNGTALLMMMRN